MNERPAPRSERPAPGNEQPAPGNEQPAHWSERQAWTAEPPAGMLPAELIAQLPGVRDLAVRLAVEAGQLVADERERALAAAGAVDTKTTDTDVVTVMDRRSEELLRARLAHLRPGERILGEEEGASELSAGGPGPGVGITWVLDPIDGTVNYLYGLAEYAVSVAAVVGDPTREDAWWPVAGAVARPASGEVYSAHLGGGASLRGPRGTRPLRCSRADRLAGTLLGTGFGYDTIIRAEQAGALADILPAVRDIRRGGSAALDLCHVAEGALDAYAERGVHVWDVAAGVLVAAEAGASVGTWDGGAGRPRGVLAAPPALRPALEELMIGAYARATSESPGADGRRGGTPQTRAKPTAPQG